MMYGQYKPSEYFYVIYDEERCKVSQNENNNGPSPKDKGAEIKILSRPQKRRAPGSTSKKSSSGRKQIPHASPSSDPSATSWNCTLSDDFEADYRLISSMLDLSVSSILKMEEDILNAVVDYARKNSINGKQATHEEGVFHYETYNEVLKLHDPNALLTTPLSLSRKTLQPLVKRFWEKPVVEEIDEDFSYGCLSAMRHPGTLRRNSTAKSADVPERNTSPSWKVLLR